MATVSKSYDAVVLGVSQQVPSKRLSGQHWTQDDFVSDPVRGLRRRPGARRLAEAETAGDAADIGTNFREFDVLADDRYVSLLCRRPGNTGPSKAVFAFQRGTYGAVTDGSLIPTTISSAAATLLAGGVNSVAAVGDFFVIAHTQPVGSTETEYYDATVNRRRAVVAVKAATYSRQYIIRVKRVGGTEVVGTYTVPSLYNGDGSINAAAAAAAQPNNVAFQLFTSLETNASFALEFACGVRGSSILFECHAHDIEYITAVDQGDNTQITVAWREVQDPAELPAQGWNAHVVRVRPKNQDSVYYLKSDTQGAGNDGKVIWREWTAAGVSLVNAFCLGRIYSNVLYIGANPADLQAQLTGAGSTEIVPTLAAREVGDDDTMPAPYFVGREITELRVFQERLLVCCGPVVNASRVSSFFNFWRTTVLTYPDDDAVEMYATGSEADTIRASVVFDRSVVFFGDQQQYAVSGKVPLTGATATIMQSSAHRDASEVRPVALGELLFFIKSGRRYVTAHQIAVGNVEDTSNSTEISRQLHDFLQGAGIECVGLSMPDTVLLRTSTPNVLYAYAFMDDDQRGRVFDAWSRWVFSPACGTLCAVGSYKDAPRPVFVQDAGGGNVRLIVTEIDLTDTSDDIPHLDSWYYNGAFPVRAGEHCAYSGLAAASQRWFGREDSDTAALIAEFGASSEIVLGYPMGGVVRLTSPYVTDSNGKPIEAGSLVVTTINIDVKNSGAMTASTELSWGGEQPGLVWDGRTLGSPGNLVGQRQLHDGTQSVVIGRESGQYVLRLSAVKWHPLTITGINWTGQFFKRSRSI